MDVQFYANQWILTKGVRRNFVSGMRDNYTLSNFPWKCRLNVPSFFMLQRPVRGGWRG